MILKIVCSGKSSFKSLYVKEKNEFILAVDGGAKDLLEAGVPIDLALGDFDSFDVTFLLNIANKVVKYPVEKDFSDLELALQYVKDWKAKRIDIYNATGNRQDHFISLIMLLKKYAHMPIYVFDEVNKIFCIQKPTMIQKGKYHYLSLFAYEEDTIVSLKDVKYPLDQYNLSPVDSLCLSNEIIHHEAFVEVNDKPLLVVQSKA